MEKTWIHSVSVQTDRGERAELSYYLLTQSDGFTDRYGVEVTMRTAGREESAAAAGLTPVGGEVLRLLGLLSGGAVTPAGLADVVQDWLA